MQIGRSADRTCLVERLAGLCWRDSCKRSVADERRLRSVKGRSCGAEIRGEDEGTAQQRDRRGIIGRRLEAQAHWQLELDEIARLPSHLHAQVTRFVAACGERRAIQARDRRRAPGRDAHRDVKGLAPADRLDAQPHAFLERVARFEHARALRSAQSSSEGM